MSSGSLISIDRITIDPRLQTRAALNGDAVADYADRYREGADMPPVVVFRDDHGDHWLADGFHRIAAAQAAGLAEIPADVREGEFRDALLYAASANAAHGLRRTNADKRRAVEMLAADKEWMQWSDKAVADHCGVSIEFVRVVRKELMLHLTTQPLVSDRADGLPSGAVVRIYRNKHGGISTMNVANIGKGRRKAAPAPPAADIPDVKAPPGPCPFCAYSESEIHFSDADQKCRVYCAKCGACGPAGDTEERAAFEWNYRQ